jgi:hypothetical protein
MDALFTRETKLCQLSIPLLLRLFEFIREEETTDEDLHFMAERISELAWDGVRMTMNEYESIIPKKMRPEPKPVYLAKAVKQDYLKTTDSEATPE